MNLLLSAREIFQLAYLLAKTLVKCLLGYPLVTPAFVSATIDIDDVVLAKRRLKDDKDWFKPGIVKEYESAFAAWNGSKYAFAFMGARVALSACIYALGLKPGDEVILPGYTCVVVPNAFHFAGIGIIYSDIELDTYGLDVSLVEGKITPKTRAVFIQHLYGLVCRDYEKIIDLAKKRGLFVIEDCAQSAGAVFKNRKVGNLCDVAIYSTEHTKVFTTIKGGLAVTNKETFALRLKEYYNQAVYPDKEFVRKLLHNVIVDYSVNKDFNRWWKAEVVRFLHKNSNLEFITGEEKRGIKPDNYECKMPGCIALIGLNQLKKLDYYNEKRRKSAIRWDKWCDENGYKKPLVIPDSLPVYLRYPVMVEPKKKRDASWALRELKVSLGVWFSSNIHPVNWQVDGCPNADKAVKQCINFPCLKEE